jgi:hypothetical protein
MRILKKFKYVFAVCIICAVCIYTLFAVGAITTAYRGYYDNIASGAAADSNITIGSTASDSSMNIVYDRDLDSYSTHKAYIKVDALTEVYITDDGASEVVLKFNEYQRCSSMGVNSGSLRTGVNEIWEADFEINASYLGPFVIDVNWYEIQEAGNIYHKDA